MVLHTVYLSNTLVFAPKNNSEGKKDATGAFIPEAYNFAKSFGCDPVKLTHLVDNSPEFKKTWSNFWPDFIDLAGGYAPGSIENLVLFCHGLTKRVQFFDKEGLKKMLEERASRFSKDLIVMLNCCDTGGATNSADNGDGAFADTIRDMLCASGITYCTVYGHTVSAHTTKNPYKRVFEGKGSPVGGTGGNWVVAPKSSLWATWRNRITDPKDDLRYKYPFMELADLHNSLMLK